MASPTDFALKHGVATAGAIPMTIAANWYLETLSPGGIAVVFLFFLAIFNALAAFLPSGRKSSG